PQQRGLDEVAGAGLAALEERAEDPCERGDAGDVVADAAAEVRLRGIRWHGQRGKPGAGPEAADVVAGATGVGPVAAVTGDAGIDQRRVRGPHRFRSEPQLVD